jgi:hypothetical protein
MLNTDDRGLHCSLPFILEQSKILLVLEAVNHNSILEGKLSQKRAFAATIPGCHADCCVAIGCIDSHRIDEARLMLFAWCITDADVKRSPIWSVSITRCLTIDSSQEEASRPLLPLESRLWARGGQSSALCSTSLFLPLTLHPQHGTRYPVASMGMQCMVANVRRDARYCCYSVR